VSCLRQSRPQLSGSAERRRAGAVRELWRDRLHIWRTEASHRARSEIQSDPFSAFRLLSLAAAVGKLFFWPGNGERCEHGVRQRFRNRKPGRVSSWAPGTAGSGLPVCRDRHNDPLDWLHIMASHPLHWCYFLSSSDCRTSAHRSRRLRVRSYFCFG
jgi:hypothetical protein